MPIKFDPKFTISPKIANNLLRIQEAKLKVLFLPLTPFIIASLRETARLYTTHYSTMIEGNRLEPEEIEGVLKHKQHFPGREREEKEVKGYYRALQQIEQWALEKKPVTESLVHMLHAHIMSGGRERVANS